MEDSVEKYGLDLHCTMILEDYRARWSSFAMMKEIIIGKIKQVLSDNGILVTAIEGRIKTEASLAGKLELKGQKYKFLEDITDIIGIRVITFYTDDVDKIAALAENLFHIDWANSVDKRKMHQLDSFGYMSLHYVCHLPVEIYSDPDNPWINEFPFEIQLRTTLQHMWANMNHDIGYKSGFDIPREHLRNLNRLAGMLELADDEFSRIRTSINDYRRQVTDLVANGKFDDVSLNGDTFKNYLNLKPFDKLNHRIAAINQAEIHDTSVMPYLRVFKLMGFNTLGDVERMLKEDSDDAFQLAMHQIGSRDIDILSSTVAVMYLCIVHILKNGGGEEGLTAMFNEMNGVSDYSRDRAHRVMGVASHLNLVKEKA